MDPILPVPHPAPPPSRLSTPPANPARRRRAGAVWLRMVRRGGLILRRHPRTGVAAALCVLLGSAVTAFALVPPVERDALPVSTRVITEPVPLGDLRPQLDALEQRALTLSAQTTTRGSDSLDSLMARLGVNDPEASAFLRRDAQARRILQGRSGMAVRARYEQSAGGITRLLALVAQGPAMSSALLDSHFTRISVARGSDGHWQASTEQRPLGHQVLTAAGYIRTSLFAAADDARVPESVVLQLADIFGSDVDFRRDLRQGDRFSLVYEAPTADGEPVSWTRSGGRVLAARMVNQGRSLDAMWFQEAGNERGAYYAADGLNKARTFLASPLAFSRISSGFQMRLHPILHTWRAHLGVDYAAASGTPVRAVADGTVDFAGWQSGYGNVVIVRHGGSRSTLYAHLSRVGVQKGQRVVQAQPLGQVGATGWATGPHLHFEFKLDGRQMDPVKMARSSEAQRLGAASRPLFDAQFGEARAQLAAAELPATPTALFARME